MTRSLALLLALASVATPLTAQTSGAIYTSDRSGSLVNGNTYGNQRDVYLVGGPGAGAPCTAAGLPDGRYYFQVTNPSGQLLLSTDPIADREVVVQGGVIVAHVTGAHRTYPGPCGSRVVQLIPFQDSPSSAGEYKVWLTPTARYDPMLGGFHGFASRYSKTDNFKVRQGRPVDQSVIHGFKFYDASEDGLWNPGLDPREVPIPGWRVEILRNGVLDGVTYTDETGRYCFIRPQDGTVYTIREIAPGGFVNEGIAGARWLAVTPRSASVTATATGVRGPDFGNLYLEVKTGVGRTKGFWHNQNGRALLQACDPLWRQVLVERQGVPICLRRNVSTANPALSLYLPLQPPATFAQAADDLSNWLVGEAALGHAGYILSTQVAAAILNQACGFMQFTVYVDRFQNGVLVSFDSMVQGVSALLCHPDAGLTGPQDPAQALRAAMLACINEFGGINNTGDPTAPQVVYGPRDTPGDFESPY